MFESILITGDGEVAGRVERTCKRIGLDLAAADEPTRGWNPDVDALLATAKRTGAQAVHPGYVAPSTRTRLARAVREAGLAFVGPSTAALEAMSDKLALKEAARRADVFCVDDCGTAVQDARSAHTAAERLGYPVFVKPVTGSASMGIARASTPEELEQAFAHAARVAEETFGDGRVFVERALVAPRQIDVTVLCEEGGTPTTLLEREGSLQRDFRVMVAETPSPLLLQRADGEAIREALFDAAVRIATEIGLTGLATFEFLLDPQCRIFFLEANADLHGAILATEMLTDFDPIELQLELAAGVPLGSDSRFRPSGHAFEVRVLAEEPGKVERFRFPPAPHGKVRIEPAVELGEEVPMVPEPLVARIATYAPIRHQALLALDRTLAESQIEPVRTNLKALRKVLNHDAFRFGQYDVDFLSRL